MLGGTYAVAILLAFGAAIAAASHNLFIRVGTDRGTIYDAFFVVMTISTLVLVPVIFLGYYPDFGLTAVSWVSFLTAGLFGTLFGMVCLYGSIERIGASRTTPIVASSALMATLLGVVLLGETVTEIHALGIVLIVVGVGAIGWETSAENPEGLSRRELLLSFTLPLAAAVAFGTEPILANYGFAEGTPAPVGLAIKTGAAWAGFVFYLRWKNALPRLGRLPSTDLRWYALAGIANTLFLIGYYIGLELAPVNVVVPIIITNALFVIVLSALFMPRRLERVTWRLVAAALVVVVGAMIVTVYA